MRYHNRALQLRPASRYAPARSTVTVCEGPDGRIAIAYRGRPIPRTEVTGTNPPPARPAAARGAVGLPAGPGGRGHPWRLGFKRMRPTVEADTTSVDLLKGTFQSSQRWGHFSRALTRFTGDLDQRFRQAGHPVTTTSAGSPAPSRAFGARREPAHDIISRRHLCRSSATPAQGNCDTVPSTTDASPGAIN